jgi:hypothetical protein
MPALRQWGYIILESKSQALGKRPITGVSGTQFLNPRRLFSITPVDSCTIRLSPVVLTFLFGHWISWWDSERGKGKRDSGLDYWSRGVLHKVRLLQFRLTNIVLPPSCRRIYPLVYSSILVYYYMDRFAWTGKSRCTAQGGAVRSQISPVEEGGVGDVLILCQACGAYRVLARVHCSLIWNHTVQ